MNGSEPSGPRGRSVADSAGQMIDDADLSTLSLLAQTFDEIDPVPAGLVDRLRFGLALDEMLAEVARVTRVSYDAMSVRGDSSPPARTQTLTFDADAVTAMVTVQRISTDRLRVDGWLAPAISMRVRLRMQGERRQAVADESGRFSFDNLPEGFAQLTLHPAEPEDADAAVVTPMFEL